MKNSTTLLKKTIVLLLGTSGIVWENMTVARWLSIALSAVAVYILFKYPSFELGIIYWSFSMVLHYTVLFGTFVKGGFKEYWLKNSVSKEEAHKKFEACLSFAFFHNGTAFSFLYFTTMERADFSFMPGTWVLAIGITLQIVGFIIKFLATWEIGVGLYYYKDMFIEEKVLDSAPKGIFNYMSNPLYGWGQLNGYGAALYAFSWSGVAAVLVNQVFFYTFYFLLEKPFVERFYLTPSPAFTPDLKPAKTSQKQYEELEVE